MNVGGWIAGFVAVVLVESLIGMAVVGLGITENCDNGIPRLECSELLLDLLRVSLFAVPALYVVLLALAVKRVQESRRESETPN